MGFLGVAQIDRFANINTTVIGSYENPKVRLPGSGGASEIATSCGEIFVITAHRSRTLIPKVDFVTSFGHGDGGDHRQRLGIQTKGPSLVVTDLSLMRPDPETKELEVMSIHEGVTRGDIEDNTGWPIRFARRVEQTPPPTSGELEVLRDLHARTARAHAGAT